MYPHSGQLYRLRKKLLHMGNKKKTENFHIGYQLQLLIDEGKEKAEQLPFTYLSSDDMSLKEDLAHRIALSILEDFTLTDYDELRAENPWVSTLNEVYWDAIPTLIEEEIFMFLKSKTVESS